MQSVILHIGLPKTGTTFLQNWLGANLAVFAKHELAVLSTPAAHRLAVTALTHDIPEGRADIVELRKVDLDQALKELYANSAAKTVVSSEYFTISDPSKLAQFFSDKNIMVSSVICFVRRQDRYLAASHRQAIRESGEVVIVRRGRYIEACDWNLMFDRWSNAFPSAKMSFRNYDFHRRYDSLLSAYKSDIAIAHQASMDSVDADRSNEGLSAELTEVARLMNERGLKSISRFLTDLQRQDLPGSPFSFSDTVVKGFEAAFVAGNNRLAQRTGCEELAELGQSDWKAEGLDFSGSLPLGFIARVLALAAANQSAASLDIRDRMIDLLAELAS